MPTTVANLVAQSKMLLSLAPLGIKKRSLSSLVNLRTNTGAYFLPFADALSLGDLVRNFLEGNSSLRHFTYFYESDALL